MKFLYAKQIKEADAYTIENEHVSSIDLMERAAGQCAMWINNNYPDQTTPFAIFAGPGNNGGDGLAVARMLAGKNYRVKLYIVKISNKFSDDFSVNLERLQKQGQADIHFIEEANEFPEISPGTIVVDALFGSGLSRPLEKLPAEVAKQINSCNAEIISIDIPSGLFAEEAVTEKERVIIKATYTLTFQFPKLAFFFRENREFMGKWHVLPIGLHQAFIDESDSKLFYTTRSDISEWIKPRDKFSHKGTYGKGLLIAGSYGMIGAAILATRAAMCSGIGLITTHVPHFGYSILQTTVPEAIISIDESDIIFTEYPELSAFSAVGVGPALGKRMNSQKALRKLIEECRIPLVLDADALNILGKNKDWLKLLPANTILTPHPKEFERISEPVKDSFARFKLQKEFSEKYNVIVVLKGAYTCVSTPDGACYFNSTGNPGMASGGSGDVLTGIILSMLAQGFDPLKAAISAVYIHGLAGDVAATKKSEEAMIASDIIDNFGDAFKKLK